MSHKLNQGQLYRMPIHFGPRTGPRQGPDGQKFDNKNTPRTTSIAVSFLTNPDQLRVLLPRNFELTGEPIVTVAATYITEIEWLAGRGYNTLGVSFPVMFRGEQDYVTGNFLTVLWENLADPIITGREELGFSKIYCELPEPRVLRDERHVIASWLGFKFLDLHVTNLVQQSDAEIAVSTQSSRNDGTLHYKYFPRTGEWGIADVAYACITPASTPNRIITERWTGDGTLQFHKARWEDMPTQYNIVNTFFGLEIQEYLGASVTKTVGGKDLSDQRILR